MEQNNKSEIVLSKIPSWVSVSLLIFTLSFFGYLIWNNNNLSNRILTLENQQITNKPFQITKFEKDSILLELNKYQQKEDYFTTALEVQAAHYEHITSWGITISAFLLAMVGLIGVGWFWSSYDKLKDKIANLENKIEINLTENQNKVTDEIEKIKSKFKSLEKINYLALANTLSLASNSSRQIGDFVRAYFFSIEASYWHKKSNEKRTEPILANIKIARENLIKIGNTDIDTPENIDNYLIAIASIDNKEIKYIINEIMKKHNAKFK